jgi:hypothetical protein
MLLSTVGLSRRYFTQVLVKQLAESEVLDVWLG